jgi:hypothetical protein
VLDIGHLLTSQNCDVQIFAMPSVSGNEWFTWNKPGGKSMVHIICIGGGGGGGAGHSASGAAHGSGGGGGSSQTIVTIPIGFLPDRLFIQVGAGGTGAATDSVNGGSGGLSYVNIVPDTSVANTVAISGTVAAGGGTSNANATGGGSGGTVASLGIMPLAGFGRYNFLAGQAGAPESTGVTLPTTGIICTGGCGGRGATGPPNFGFTFTSIADSFLSEQIPAAPSLPADIANGDVNGSGGPTLWKPLFFFGGVSGSGTNSSTPGHNAGSGGNASYGSGGGGGGGQGGAGTAGSGGTGGSGIVIIISW